VADATRKNKEDALRWWRSQVEAGRLVLSRDELPKGVGRGLLIAGGYAAEVSGGQAWILKTPEQEADDAVILRNYWLVVLAVLTNYRPAVIERESAVRLYLGRTTPPDRLKVRHASSRSRYTFGIVEGLELQLMPGDVVLEEARRLAVDRAELPVDRPERTLLGIPLNTLREHLDDVAIWLSSLVASRPALEEEWRRYPRPLVIKRVAEVARDAGNVRLADQLDSLLAAEHGQHISRARTGVGREIVVPPLIARVRSAAPWLTRHSVGFRRFARQMTDEVEAADSALPRFEREELIRRAVEAKRYDAYHSTTIEGYEISPEEVAAVIEGKPVFGHGPEKVRSRMAVKGYSAAFDLCVEGIRAATGPIRLTEDLILDLHAEVFSPSVEAGIVDAEALRGWRSQPAYLRGSRYVPPSAEKLPRLMQQFTRLIDSLTAPTIVRAALTHLDFAAVHPFADGNGRIARFLMNLVLVTGGLPWVTIRADDRQRYFQALDSATLDDDARPFARFVLEYVERATAVR